MHHSDNVFGEKNQQISENTELRETISSLRKQISSLMDKCSKREDSLSRTCLAEASAENGVLSDGPITSSETSADNNKVSNSNCFANDSDDVSKGCHSELSLKSQVLMQVLS